MFTERDAKLGLFENYGCLSNQQFLHYAYYVFKYFFIPGVGHLLLLHDLLMMFSPTHSLPPFSAVVSLVLFLRLNPLPHDLEHFDHRPHLDQ